MHRSIEMVEQKKKKKKRAEEEEEEEKKDVCQLFLGFLRLNDNDC